MSIEQEARKDRKRTTTTTTRGRSRRRREGARARAEAREGGERRRRRRGGGGGGGGLEGGNGYRERERSVLCNLPPDLPEGIYCRSSLFALFSDVCNHVSKECRMHRKEPTRPRPLTTEPPPRNTRHCNDIELADHVGPWLLAFSRTQRHPRRSARSVTLA